MEKAVVVIVEDEALIRMNAVSMLEDAGYTVLEACNADEAILTPFRAWRWGVEQATAHFHA
jgi:CheY-like chemotaxis protein